MALNLKSTAWARGSVNSSGWTKSTVSSSGFTKSSAGNTSFEPGGLFSDFALLLQDGVSKLLLQDGVNFWGLQT